MRGPPKGMQQPLPNKLIAELVFHAVGAPACRAPQATKNSGASVLLQPKHEEKQPAGAQRKDVKKKVSHRISCANRDFNGQIVGSLQFPPGNHRVQSTQFRNI